MDYRLTDDQRMIREAAGAFAQEQLEPQSEAIEDDPQRLKDALREAGALGFLGMRLPEDLGGIGADMVSFALAVEEVSKASASVGSFLIVGNALLGEALHRYGRQDVTRPWIERLISGASLAAIVASPDITVAADGGGFRVNGRHETAPGAGVADVVLVQARLAVSEGDDSGYALLLAPIETSGLRIGDIRKTMGLRGAAVAVVAFHDCVIPENHLIGAFGQGEEILNKIAAFTDTGVAAQALGLAEAACGEAGRYAEERRQFGHPISRFQAIAFMLAEMRTEIEAARHLVYHAAWLRDQDEDSRVAAAQARLHTVGMANRVANTALQIHGGYGYIREYPAERYFRDARMLGVIDGPPEMQKRIIAGEFIE